MNNSKSRRVAFIGAMGAVVFVSLLIESYVFARLFAGFNPAVLSIPLALSLCLFSKDKTYMFLGLILGVCSMIIGCMLGFYEIWLNPLISLLPRLLMGVVAYFVCRLFEKVFSKSSNKFVSKTLPISIGAICGAIVNTVLVLTMMVAFSFNTLGGVLAIIISLNTPAEIIACAVLTPLFVKTERKVYKEGDETDEETETEL